MCWENSMNTTLLHGKPLKPKQIGKIKVDWCINPGCQVIVASGKKFYKKLKVLTFFQYIDWETAGFQGGRRSCDRPAWSCSQKLNELWCQIWENSFCFLMLCNTNEFTTVNQEKKRSRDSGGQGQHLRLVVVWTFEASSSCQWGHIHQGYWLHEKV